MAEALKKQPSVKAGWESYQRMVLSPTAPDIQISECRLAFYAGATVLFYAIMASLDEGEEPTEADLKRMDNINEEIENFAKTFDETVIKRKLAERNPGR
jgi:hypothetical protein